MQPPIWFTSPPADRRPTPLYWWSGGDVDRARVAHQLDELAGAGLGGVIVGYSHHPDGSVDHGEPAPFTGAWWDLFRWFVDACAERGLTAGFQDYNVVAQVVQRLDGATPGTSGHLVEEHVVVSDGEPVLPPLTDAVLAAVAMRIVGGDEDSGWRLDPESAVDLTTAAADDPRWIPPPGTWLVSVISVETAVVRGVSTSFDPLHPAAGQAFVSMLLQPFADELGDRLGRDLRWFFQDELEFGALMPMWSAQLPTRILAELPPGLRRPPVAPDIWLTALWHDLGPDTATVRLAYLDAVAGLLEDCFFRPVFEWHDRAGTVLAMDQMSRGDMALAHAHYADYLRTMRWFHAPGNDDPDLDGPRQIAAFKISASIAHLYGRDRVWNEGFHSSGWGVSPAAVLRGANVGFAAGATHLSLHAVYHCTQDGWWEWAAPDFHAAQPWFVHSAALWDYVARMGALLSQGIHVCDVAVLDPTDHEAVVGGRSAAADLTHVALTELPLHGVDVDLVDRASVLRAGIERDDAGPALTVAGERYRAVVVPAGNVVHAGVQDVLDSFSAAGGLVVPYAPGADGSPADLDELIEHLRPALTSRLGELPPGVMLLRRAITGGLVEVLVNTGTVDATVSLPAGGGTSLWDPWSGRAHSLAHDDGAPAWVVVPSGDARVLHTPARFQPASPATPRPISPLPSSAAPRPAPTEITLRTWTARVVPTGRPIRTWYVDVSPATPDGREPWVRRRVTDAPRLEVIGPIPPDVDETLLVDVLSAPDSGGERVVELAGNRLEWRDYVVSQHFGLVDDPLEQDLLTGPHGLKGAPHPTFLDPRAIDADAEPGSSYWFRTSVTVDLTPVDTLHVGGLAAIAVHVDGRPAYSADAPPPRRYPPWGIPDLRPSRVSVPSRLEVGRHVVLVRLRVEPEQPTRAFVAFGGNPTPGSGRLEHWNGPDAALDLRVGRDEETTTRVRIQPPPGWTSVRVVASGCTTAIDALGPETVTKDVDHEGGGAAYVVVRNADARDISTLVLAATGRDREGAVLAGPLEWSFGEHAAGVDSVELVDWELLGLGDHAGLVRYSTVVELDAEDVRSGVELDLGDVHASARVWCNGIETATLLRPPWRVALRDGLRVGPNELVVDVASTAAQAHRHLPTPYRRREQERAGLFGPVVVRR